MLLPSVPVSPLVGIARENLSEIVASVGRGRCPPRTRYRESVAGDLQHLPGGDLVVRGLADLEQRRETAESLLVSIAARRLRAAGIPIPEPFPTPELRLYALLADEDADGAHGRYNALLRRLVSFERAVECVVR